MSSFAEGFAEHARQCNRCRKPTGNWCDFCEHSFSENGRRGRALCTGCEANYGQRSICSQGELEPGQLVEIRGLMTKAELNGVLGNIVKFDGGRERYIVVIDFSSPDNEAVRVYKQTATIHSPLYGEMRERQRGVSTCLVKRASLMVTTMAEWDDRRPDNDNATIYFQKETATAAV